MNIPPRFRFADWLQLMLVLALAAALRIGYLHVATEDGQGAPALVVQGAEAMPGLPPTAPPRDQKPSSEFDVLVHKLAEENAFAAVAPLAEKEEPTAHVAPGYYWLVAQFARFDASPDWLVRWTQCGLGVLTVGCLFFFARRAFSSAAVALVAGVLAAIHPFWIINTAELGDGVLTTFLLAATLMLGARGSQAGGALTSLLFGLGLAALAMVRAALLPFAVLGLLWFLYQCRQVRHGWFNALLAFLGFANGLAPWAVRNWRLYEEPVPIATSAYWHLWMGNNPRATGGPVDEKALRETLPAERLQEILGESNQAKRYARLGHEVIEEISRDPAAAVARRWQAGMKFVVGDTWFHDQRMSRHVQDAKVAAAPEWLAANVEVCLQGMLLALIGLAVLGWRWSRDWKNSARLATIAMLWLPVPHLLSHAEELSGPRLPWDCLLICFSAYAFACLAPSVRGSVEEN